MQGCACFRRVLLELPRDEARLHFVWEIVKAFTDLLKGSENSPESWAQSGSEMWNQARMVRVRRDYPVSTASGKILPFHLLTNKATARQNKR